MQIHNCRHTHTHTLTRSYEMIEYRVFVRVCVCDDAAAIVCGALNQAVDCGKMETGCSSAGRVYPTNTNAPTIAESERRVSIC